MSDDNRSTLGRVSGGESLTMEEMSQIVDAIMQGAWDDEQIALLLNALRQKGETVEEIAGAAAALRRNMVPIRTSREGVVDTCGTGGDGSGTFNISTAAALVTAAAGQPVAKHGNRSITSKTGSADVLAQLGLDLTAPVEVVEACLDELGICFCFAPQLHPSMKNVAAARKKLGVPTIFNMIGPLCNPASAPYQLLGVGRPDLRQRLSQALHLLGTTRAIVVCGDDGLDEVTLKTSTSVTEVSSGEVQNFQWQPADFGLPPADHETLQVSGPEQSADVIRAVLGGRPGPPRDIVIANAAAALWTARRDDDPRVCAAQAADAIDSGAAGELLQRLAEATRR